MVGDMIYGTAYILRQQLEKLRNGGVEFSYFKLPV